MSGDIGEYLFREFGARCGVIGKEDLAQCVVNKRRAEGFSSALVAVFPYFWGDTPGKISLYARFGDYHTVLTGALSRAAELFMPDGAKWRVCADVSPINEVKAAALAGLGVVGKNGLLITPDYGSYVFIGEILLPYDEGAPRGEIRSCAECGACLAACPTGALRGEGECLSSLTQKKRLSPEEEAVIARCGMQWGCDACQTSCPMNRSAKKTAIPEFSGMTVEEIREFSTQGKTDGELLEAYADRAFTWRGIGVLRRNEAIVNSAGALDGGQSQTGGR